MLSKALNRKQTTQNFSSNIRKIIQKKNNNLTVLEPKHTLREFYGTKFGMQHHQEKQTRNCKSHDPPTQRGGNLGVKSVKLMYFLKKSSSLLPGIDQTNQVCSNDDQGRVYQNCKFHDPRGRGSCARAWPYKSYSENELFL